MRQVPQCSNKTYAVQRRDAPPLKWPRGHEVRVATRTCTRRTRRRGSQRATTIRRAGTRCGAAEAHRTTTRPCRPPSRTAFTHENQVPKKRYWSPADHPEREPACAVGPHGPLRDPTGLSGSPRATTSSRISHLKIAFWGPPRRPHRHGRNSLRRHPIEVRWTRYPVRGAKPPVGLPQFQWTLEDAREPQSPVRSPRESRALWDPGPRDRPRRRLSGVPPPSVPREVFPAARKFL